MGFREAIIWLVVAPWQDETTDANGLEEGGVWLGNFGLSIN